MQAADLRKILLSILPVCYSDLIGRLAGRGATCNEQFVRRGFLTQISEKQTSRMYMLIRDRSLPKVLINYYLKSMMTDGRDDDIFCLQHQSTTGFAYSLPRWQGV